MKITPKCSQCELLSTSVYEKPVAGIITRLDHDNWFFNTRFDGDLQYLKLFSKRCKRYADAEALPDKTNKLWIVWSNMKVMLDKNDSDYYREVMFFTAVMSKKIDDYSQTNMLDGDPTIGRIFHELNEITFCQYDLLNV